MNKGRQLRQAHLYGGASQAVALEVLLGAPEAALLAVSTSIGDWGWYSASAAAG